MHPKVMLKRRDLYQAPKTWCQVFLEGSIEVLHEILDISSEGLNASSTKLHVGKTIKARIPKALLDPYKEKHHPLLYSH